SIDRKLLDKLKREFKAELSERYKSDTDKNYRQKTDIRIQSESREANSEIALALQSGLHYAIGNNRSQITFYTELEVADSEPGTDYVESYFLPDAAPLEKTADQRYEKWHRDYVVDFKRSYLQYQFAAFGDAEFDILIGRDYVYWGTSPEKSVSISDNSPPFELVRFTAKIGPLKATAFTSQLNSTWYDDGTTRYLAKRFLSAHRLDYRFRDWLEIGISEMVLYGGDVQALQWEYVNPFIPYYAVQYNAKKDDNIILSFDASVRPVDGLRLYAEWLADDFQYQSDSNDPHAVAWISGFDWYPLFMERQLGIHSEYVRINRWTYTHLESDNQFTHFGAIIGHPIGTDADMFSCSLSYQATPSALIKTRFSYQRNGEANVTDRFYGEDFESIPFPSGTVERLSEIRVGWQYRPIGGFNGSINYAWRHIQNRDNTESDSEQQHRIVVLLAYAWTK
ncbi:capsule assembly Wzi family protein, partial [Candidatus Poribacteria bacterium]|nr:capsule assembly Wzi family protein [Candidatus Poribacteria bacterium]